jgi:methionyl-tRNA formyltransferase
MLAKVRRPIRPDETSDVVERDLAAMGARLLVEVVDQLAAGTAVEEPQDYMFATYAPKVTKEEGLIDWTLPASFIHNRVRGLYPWPHAYTYLEGKRLIVLRTQVVDTHTSAAPGTIVDVSGGVLHVATGHGGCIAIELVQPEGRRPMSPRDFLAGHPVRVGATFTRPPAVEGTPPPEA